MIHTRHAAARVDFHLVEPGEFKHLRVNLQAVTCPHVPDTVLLFFAAPVAGKLPASRGAYPFTSREVQEILPVARNRALLQLAALIVRGLMFEYIGLTAMGAYITLYRRHLAEAQARERRPVAAGATWRPAH